MPSTQTHTVTLERTFDATQEELYNAWIDPDIYKHWMNPAGIELVVREWDAHEGGKVAFDMPQPDGNQNPQSGMFHVLDPYDRIVTGEPDKSFMIEVKFIRADAGTTMRVTITGLPSEYREPATEGWNVCLDRLEAVLERSRGGLVLSRAFDAPPTAVWQAWTDPQQFAAWWGPRGFTTTVRRLEVRPGGTYHYCMHDPDGTDYWGTGEYLEVDPPRRMLMTDNFSDAQGNIVPASRYGLPDRTGTSHVEVTLEEVGEDRTRLTLRHTGLTGEDLAGAEQGWTEMVDKLASYLTEAAE